MNRLTVFLLATVLIISVKELKSQNSGPMAPEAMAFEPIDVTDIVNLSTGDLTYTIPLMEVPGPAGGYPIVLSYHSGIAMDQEASWVGLGWSLNPGVINRNLNGFPDDLNGGTTQLATGNCNVATTVDGSISLSVSVFKKTFSSVGVSYSWGSNKGFGGSVELGKNSNLKAEYGVFVSENDVTVNTKLQGANLSAGYSASSAGNGNGNIQAFSTVSLDYSLSSTQKGIGISNLGSTIVSSIRSSEQNNGNNILSLVSFTIPTPWVTLDYKNLKRRHFYSTDSERKNFGILYTKNAYKQSTEDHIIEDGAQDPDYQMDVVSELYKAVESEDFKRYANSENNMIFPAYDDYTVTAQGISGIVSPKLLQSSLLFGKSEEIDLYDRVWWECGNDEGYIAKEVRYYNEAANIDRFSLNPEQIYFYFRNETSSSLITNNGTFNKSGTISDPLSEIYYSGSSKDITTSNGYENYNSNTNRKITGKYVEWFTNSQIRNSLAKSKMFIEDDDIHTERRKKTTLPDGSEIYDASYFSADGIGGFMITDINGVSYHYSIPVYQFAELLIQKGGFHPNDVTLNEDLNMYANSWLLTAITGPDYVDLNNDGKLDDSDDGYWVKFKYGKWSDGYIWQLPYVSKVNEPYRIGSKQVYYLNSIETKSHIALFAKSERHDGKSKAVVETHEIKLSGDDYYRAWEMGDNEQLAARYLANCQDPEKQFQVGWLTNQSAKYRFDQRSYVYEIDVPVKHTSLKLDKVILLKKPYSVNTSLNDQESLNIGSLHSRVEHRFVEIEGASHDDIFYVVEDLAGSNAWETAVNAIFYDEFYLCNRFIDFDFKEGMLFNNILSKDEVGENIEDHIIKAVDFLYNYELCTNTPNSDAAETSGKLTLESLAIKGKKGHDVLPPYNFAYYQSQNNYYNLDYQDEWGYNSNEPKEWSLKEIQTPLGATISIEYESDSYISEASVNELNYYINGDLGTVVTNGGSYVDVEFSIPDKYNLEQIQNRAINYTVAGTFEGHQKIQEWQNVLKRYDPDAPLTNKTERFYAAISPTNIDVENRLISFRIPFIDEQIRMDEVYLKYYYPIKVIDYCIKASISGECAGGGLRASRVSISDETNNANTTEYSYSNGIISFSPTRPNYYFVPYLSQQPAPQVMYKNVEVKALNENSEYNSRTLYEFNTLVPSGNVNDFEYELGNALKVNDIQSLYDFGSIRTQEDYDAASSKALAVYEKPNSGLGSVWARSTEITNNKASIGRLQNRKEYNRGGDLYSETIYEYFSEDEIDLGVVSENYQYIKNIYEWDICHNYSYDYWHFNSSSLISYPSILKSVTSKGALGVHVTTYNEFDNLTGEALKVTNSYKNIITETEVLPAYRVTSYEGTRDNIELTSGMGSKVFNIHNANMLTQSAATLTKKNGEVIDASIQTWNDSWSYLDWDGSKLVEGAVETTDKVWRKHKTFIWGGDMDSDGTYSSDFSLFADINNIALNWDRLIADEDHPSHNPKWIKTSEVEHYDHYSSPIEVSDINGDFAASKKDPKDIYTVATAANARYSQFAHATFEHGPYSANQGECGVYIYNTGNVKHVIDDNAPVHTGLNSLEIPAANVGILYRIPDTEASNFDYPLTFMASVWVYDQTETFSETGQCSGPLTCILTGPGDASESSELDIFRAGKWVRLTKRFVVRTAGELNFRVRNWSNSAIYVDDFRVAPQGSAVSAYTYDNAGNVTAILNNKNIATKYAYDNAGRLTATYVEKENGFAKVSSNSYNYVSKLSVQPEFTISDENPMYGQDFTVTATDTDPAFNYEWNFSDGRKWTGWTATHRFLEEDRVLDDDSYWVTLTVSDDIGNSLTSEALEIIVPYMRIEANNCMVGGTEYQFSFYSSTTTGKTFNFEIGSSVSDMNEIIVQTSVAGFVPYYRLSVPYLTNNVTDVKILAIDNVHGITAESELVSYAPFHNLCPSSGSGNTTYPPGIILPDYTKKYHFSGSPTLEIKWTNIADNIAITLRNGFGMADIDAVGEDVLVATIASNHSPSNFWESSLNWQLTSDKLETNYLLPPSNFYVEIKILPCEENNFESVTLRSNNFTIYGLYND